MRVVIDAGHGGSDSGAVGCSGVFEKDLNLSVALKIAGLLSVNDLHEVRLTRYEDHFLGLQERCDIANDWMAGLFISIHCNAFNLSTANGFEVWTNPETDPADYFASLVWHKFRAQFPGMTGRVDLSDGDPDKESKFYVLVHTGMPAILFELGFISNPDDEERLISPSWQNEAAMVFMDSINDWRTT